MNNLPRIVWATAGGTAVIAHVFSGKKQLLVQTDYCLYVVVARLSGYGAALHGAGRSLCVRGSA